MNLMVFDCIWLNLIVTKCIGMPLNKSMVYYNVSEYISNVVTNRIERLHHNFKVHGSILDTLHFKDLNIVLATTTSYMREL